MKNIFEGLFGKGNNNGNEEEAFNNKEKEKNHIDLSDAEILKDKVEIDLGSVNINLGEKMIVSLDNEEETELTGRFVLDFDKSTKEITNFILRIEKRNEKEICMTLIDKDTGVELYSDPLFLEDEDDSDIKITLFNKDDDSLGIELGRKRDL